ncbi:MAG: LysR family transcriptional regulator [Kiloniellales bacterium]|nr:LysR family transcriptional regulator [Kiloniellales bacterium]
MHAPVLRYFEAVVATGSMRRAAERLNVASSAINRQIIRLEQDLGTTLFHRLPRGVELTPAGRLLLDHIRRTLSDFESLRGEIQALSGLRSGRVTIWAIDSLLIDVLPNAISDFLNTYPLITCTVEARSPTAITRGLRNDDVDIGISFVPRRASRLDCRVSIAAPLGLIVKPSHPLAERAEVSLADCAGYPLVRLPDTMPVIEEEMAASKLKVTPMATSESLLFHKKLILNGIGGSFFTPLAYLQEIAAGDLTFVPLAHPALRALRIGVFVSADRQPSPAAAVMLDHLCGYLQSVEADIGRIAGLSEPAA